MIERVPGIPAAFSTLSHRPWSILLRDLPAEGLPLVYERVGFLV